MKRQRTEEAQIGERKGANQQQDDDLTLWYAVLRYVPAFTA